MVAWLPLTQAILNVFLICELPIFLRTNFFFSVLFLQGLILTSVVVFYFGVLSGFAPNYAWLLVIRFLVGYGIGGAPQSYVYIQYQSKYVHASVGQYQGVD